MWTGISHHVSQDLRSSLILGYSYGIQLYARISSTLSTSTWSCFLSQGFYTVHGESAKLAWLCWHSTQPNPHLADKGQGMMDIKLLSSMFQAEISQVYSICSILFCSFLLYSILSQCIFYAVSIVYRKINPLYIRVVTSSKITFGLAFFLCTSLFLVLWLQFPCYRPFVCLFVCFCFLGGGGGNTSLDTVK